MKWERSWLRPRSLARGLGSMIPWFRVFFVNQIITWRVPDSKVHGANMGPSGADRTQMGLMLVPWTLLSGVLGCSFPFSRRMPHNSHKPTTVYETDDWYALKMSAVDGNTKRPTARQYNAERHKGSHRKFFHVIFIVWASFGTQGHAVLTHHNHHVITSMYPQKWMSSNH